MILTELKNIDITYFKAEKNRDYAYISEFYNTGCPNFSKVVDNSYLKINREMDSYKIIKIEKFIVENTETFGKIKIDFSENTFIKNERDLMIALITFFLLKKILMIETIFLQRVDEEV